MRCPPRVTTTAPNRWPSRRKDIRPGRGRAATRRTGRRGQCYASRVRARRLRRLPEATSVATDASTAYEATGAKTSTSNATTSKIAIRFRAPFGERAAAAPVARSPAQESTTRATGALAQEVQGLLADCELGRRATQC